jgi:signal transduction histidine kinase/HD-like signal output (HDOD) protein
MTKTVPRPPKILVIDDSPEYLRMLRVALTPEFEVETASTGALGLSCALKSPPDLILLDVVMPEVDGFETCRQFKAMSAFATTPIVFVSALEVLDNEARGLMLGAADYLIKPININIARQRIRNLLERERLRKMAEAYCDELEARVAERTQALLQAKELAESASQVKTRFLTRMGYQLRTPMAAVIGAIELAARQAGAGEVGAPLATANQAAHQMLALIDDLLDVSRLDAPDFKLNVVPFRIGSVIEGLERQFSPLARAKGLALEVHLPPALAGLTVEGDAERLQQILRNLLDNALKFTERGHVAVQVARLDEPGGNIALRFDVTDTGSGISAADQRRLFQLFEQIESAEGRQGLSAEFTGLGLPICRRLAELMGGNIAVSSTPGSGSSFSLTVRLARTDQRSGLTSLPRANAESARASLATRHGQATLLLADNDPIARQVLTLILADAGLAFDVAVDAEGALRMIKAKAYDLLLIGLDLASANGVDLVAAIRATRGRKHVPILAITEKSLDACRAHCNERGINDLLGKPFDVDVLLETLLKWLDNNKTGRALNDQRFQMLSDIARELEGNVVFPCNPEISISLQQSLAQADLAFDELLRLISLDPLLACKMLQRANAQQTASQLPPVRDLKAAIRLLTPAVVQRLAGEVVQQQIAVAASMAGFESAPLPMWHHSVFVAQAARVIGQRLTTLNPDECLLAGLVHDLGAHYMIYRTALYSELRMRPETVAHLVAQWHDSIGQTLLETLQMPSAIADAAANHDSLAAVPSRPRSLRDVVYLANLLAAAEGILPLADETAPADDGKVRLPESCRALLPEIKEAVRALSAAG